MKKALIIISVSVALLAVITYAGAWNPPAQGRGLNTIPKLTTEQSGKIDNLRQEFIKASLPLRDELAARKQEFRTLLSQPSADAASLKAKQKEILALRQQLQEKSLASHLDARAVLTPEQVSGLPAGYGLGFLTGTGLGRGYGRDMSYGRGCGRGMGYGKGRGRSMGYDRGSGQGMGYGKGCGRGMGYSKGGGQGMGYGRGSGFVDANNNGVCDLFENGGRRGGRRWQ